MTNQVTFPTNVGGDGSTVTDDSSATTGLANGGFRTRLLPMFTNIINIANWILGQTNAASTSASNAANSAATAVNAPGTSATSTTSLTIGAGAQSLTVQTGKLFVVGMFVTIANTAAPTNVMYGTVTSYNSSTGALGVSASSVSGSGTFSAWTISVSGGPGAFAGTAAGAIDEVKGVSIASAATVNLEAATGNFVHITGTTSITAITLNSGAERTVVFDSVLTLTYNATSLILPGGANITTAPGDTMIVRGDGSGVARVVTYVPASGLTVAVAQYMIVREQQPNGTAPANPVSGMRVLNTVVANTIAGASLASNQITLPPGTYRVQASAPSAGPNSSSPHQAYMYNVTDASTLVMGTSEYVIYGVTRSFVAGSFTLAATKSVCIKHFISGSAGFSASSGNAEVYTQVEITKVA
ncbi:hypothetical protein PQR71_13010 [Paraburkholderia fungorum]|uniref:hypothetical protein n=1 Tax=Paraburkholderia fungorum TaxID=134537 RepID=UPI0038B925C5